MKVEEIVVGGIYRSTYRDGAVLRTVLEIAERPKHNTGLFVKFSAYSKKHNEWWHIDVFAELSLDRVNNKPNLVTESESQLKPVAPQKIILK